MSSDEGTFRPPGAPGGELQPWSAGRRPVPRPTEAVEPAPTEPEPAAGDGGDGTGPGGPWWRRLDAVGESGWRLIAVAAAVLVYATAGLAWHRIDTGTCARIYAGDADMRQACLHVAVNGWDVDRWGVWLALAAGALSLLRLARRGPAWLDAAVAGVAGLAGILTVRALFSPPEPNLRLTWPGPLTLLPLVGVLVVAGAQTYRVSRRSGALSFRDVGERARERLGNDPLGWLPGWLRPAGIWRRRRRWAAAAVVLFVAYLLHSCAKDGPLGGAGRGTGALPQPAATAPGVGGTGAPATQTPTTAPSPPPDGSALLTSARQAVGAARAVSVHVEPSADVTADLQLTADLRAQGTVSAPLATYDVRRVGSRCWVRGLPGHGVAAWVATCTIPAHRGAPALNLAALTDWRVMVARLPEPAGATAAAQPERLGFATGDAVRVTGTDGSVVYLPAGEGADPHPVRVTTGRPGLGSLRVDYTQWTNEATTTITPP